jgi:phospholipase/lecithinase/hemolysin
MSCATLRANPFTEIVVFGDSHSDTGNWGVGRFSNGPVWVEELASELGLPPPTPSEFGGTNYAWGGSRTGWGYDSSENKQPKVGTQIDQFLSADEADAHQLFVLFAGHNDFGWGGQRDASVPVAHLSEHIATLAQAGRRDFFVSNLLRLGQFPKYRGSEEEAVLDRLAFLFYELLYL